jgi:iron complex transport system substrate-binding protein
MKHAWCALPLMLCSLLASAAQAAISVPDDKGAMVTLPRPAQRIVTLAPHATELVFAAGAGERIVGTVSYSDYPPAALAIPRVGSNRQVDVERLLALKPDLIVAWRHNAADRQLEPIRKLGIPVYYSEPQHIDDIPDSLLRLGLLAGTGQQAAQTAEQLRRTAAALAAKYRDRAPVRVFYQVWDKPLYTLNGRHIVSAAIRLCGGENIFADLPVTAPVVTVEAVLLAQPEVIISGNTHNPAQDGLRHWQQYPGLQAVRRGNLFAVDGDLLHRAGPRLLDGAATLCEHIDLARQRSKDQP